MSSIPNEATIADWNQESGDHWARNADRYDAELGHFGAAIRARAEIPTGARILDIGCGAGSLTLDLVAGGCRGLGVDVSEPLISVARSRAAVRGLIDAEFAVADAQCAPLGSGHDAAVSRFGVMFFADPVAAFANIRGALLPGASLTFTCWQPLERQPWLLLPAAAALAHVELPPRTSGPGGFALADPDSIHGHLDGAGFTDIQCDPLEATKMVGGPGTPDDALDFFVGAGIGRRVMEAAEPGPATAARAAVRKVFTAHHDGVGVTFAAHAWLVTARA